MLRFKLFTAANSVDDDTKLPCYTPDPFLYVKTPHFFLKKVVRLSILNLSPTNVLKFFHTQNDIFRAKTASA